MIAFCRSIMLESALTSNVFIVSQMLFNRFPENFLVRLIGVWEVRTDSGSTVVSAGLRYGSLTLSPSN